MFEGQEVVERTNSPIFCWSTNKVALTQTCMGALFFRSVSVTVFTMLFLPKPSVDHRCSVDHSLRNHNVLGVGSTYVIR
jgi:hypothetical protein